MREIERAGFEYQVKEYEVDEDLSGVHAAQALGEDPDHVFKTLVTHNANEEHFVFMIPVAHELDLKKAAKAAQEKSLTMMAVKDLLPTTGYVRGGCSPLGMKKSFPTFIHESALQYKTIAFSAGQRGLQILMNPKELASLIPAEFADITQS